MEKVKREKLDISLEKRRLEGDISGKYTKHGVPEKNISFFRKYAREFLKYFIMESLSICYTIHIISRN